MRVVVGGPSGPMPFAPVAAIRDKCIGPEGPPTAASRLQLLASRHHSNAATAAGTAYTPRKIGNSSATV
ncbi:DUF6053 domain-containing protein [Lysobacter yananisis]|uniref:DUF6053 domain-containing protein n=1 Tax=Lysobacter yananisis TaxID=1003114 RepID=UPI003CE56C81